MVLDGEYILKDIDVVNKLKTKKVAIYGAGFDGKIFFERYHTYLDIIFFIDNGSAGKSIYGLSTYSLEEVVELGHSLPDIQIVVCSRKYAAELKKSIESKQIGYWIWDIDYNSTVQRFIEHNKNLWKEERYDSANNEIIIPIEGGNNGTAVIYSYCANYLAKRYNARIKGFVRQAGTPYESNIFLSDIDVYRSFNVDEIIEIALGEDKKREAEDIYQDIVKNIKTIEDWNNICVYGYNFGITIMRDYLRKYSLSFDPFSKEFRQCLQCAVNSIVFWTNYFSYHPVKAVILWDGVHNEGYLRDIAIMRRVPTYIMNAEFMQRGELNSNLGYSYSYLKKWYNQLSIREQEEGIEWAKDSIKKIFNGEHKSIPYRGAEQRSIFKSKRKRIQLGEKATKVLICPHIFEEDQWLNGWQVCDNNYLSWLLFLGKISNETPYEWYIKPHPDESERGNKLINEFVEKFPNIKLLPTDISPYDLRRAGITHALTIAGSIGHEYPLLGIDVINAGNNPHISFDFNFNPKTKEEYKDLLMNLPLNSRLHNCEQIYEFYCIYYLYFEQYDLKKEREKWFKINKWYSVGRKTMIVAVNEKYEKFLSLYTEDWHKEIIKKMPDLYEILDKYDTTEFHKKITEVNDECR